MTQALRELVEADPGVVGYLETLGSEDLDTCDKYSRRSVVLGVTVRRAGRSEAGLTGTSSKCPEARPNRDIEL